MKRKSVKGEQGFIVVEQVFLITMTFLILTILMGFAFVIYQQTNLVVMANDAATKAASVYGYPQTDPFTGYRSLDDINKTPLYRYMKEDASFFGLREPLRESSMEKAEWIALAEMDNTAIIQAKDHEIEVHVSKREGHVGGSHVIEVKLSQTYDVPGGLAFRYFGIPNEVTFTATGRALANDMVHRMNTIDTELEALQYVEDNLFGVKTAMGVVDAVTQMINTLSAWLGLAS